MFKLIEKPVELPLSDIRENPLTSLLVAGLVNPFGPTLNAVAVVGELRPGEILPVAHIMLNPFSQAVEHIGELLIDETRSELGDLKRVFGVFPAACPSLILACSRMEPEEFILLYSDFLGQFADARTVFDRIQRNLGDPWTRVQQETDSAFKVKDRVGDCDTISALTKEEAVEFASLLLSEQHLDPEISAFCRAWGGSIEFQEKNGGGTLSANAMSLKTFADYFSRIVSKCVLPRRLTE